MTKRQGPKRELDPVTSGQFCTLAMFLLLPQDGQYMIKEEVLRLILLIHHHPTRIYWNAFKTNLYGPLLLMQATWWEISDVRKIEKAICPPLRSALCTLSKYWEYFISQQNDPTINIHQGSILSPSLLIVCFVLSCWIFSSSIRISKMVWQSDVPAATLIIWLCFLSCKQF